MTQNVIVTDLNRCTGCLSCMVACKSINNVPIGSFWQKVVRVGPTPKYPGAVPPDVEMYFLPISCQHCENPECVKVCPTGASHKLEDGSVQVDKSKCIGCQFCAMSCPYGVRYLNDEERVVEKCTLCEQRTAQGDLPQCVTVCTARARYFGDIEKGIENLEGPGDYNAIGEDKGYANCSSSRVKLGEYCEPFSDADVHHLTDVGNEPAYRYILRDRAWQGEE